MSNAGSAFRRVALSIIGLALASGCSFAPATSPPAPASPDLSSTVIADPRPGAPASFELVVDNAALHGVAVGSPRLVALPGGGFLMLKAEDMPDGGVLMRSDDGRTWHEDDASAAGLDSGAFVDLAANPTAVVVLGTTQPMTGTGTENPDPAQWVSTDGIRWTRAPDSNLFGAIGARAIVGSAIGFAIVGDSDPAILMSGPEGGPWRRTQAPVPAGATVSIARVRPTARGFLAVGTVDGRSALWRWEGAGWSRLHLVDTDGIIDVACTDGRVIVTGTTETQDPANPDRTLLSATAWESTDNGTTWADAGIDLHAVTDVRMFAVGGGFLAVLEPGDPRAPLLAWRSSRPGVWDPVALAQGGGGDRPLVSAIAVSESRVVLAGSTVGTGAGGDRVVVWVGDLGAP
jgi:hypothetical protein